jgi:GTP-binding protein
MALIDDVKIKVQGGNGGKGSSAQLHRIMKTYSDGGNGGDGGNILALGSSNVSDLSHFRYVKTVSAENGGDGLRKNQHGKNGKDTVVLLPLGTKIVDETNGREMEITNSQEPLLIARGGRGGRGNRSFGTDDYNSSNLGGAGEKLDLHLVLSLIADAGFIGFPNAGKSSLLATLTAATPKIGNYPFTTLEPSLGTMGRIVLADIPGVIEGASSGRGLGIKFLKHIEKTIVLLHCIDASGPDPVKTYNMVHKEFEEFNIALKKKKEIIILTKKDLVSMEELNGKIKLLSSLKKEIIPVSIYDDKSIEELTNVIMKNT